MNRIILIGNGFDLAHGLETKYQDFMNKYWTGIVSKIPDNGYVQEFDDDFVEFVIPEKGYYKPNISFLKSIKGKKCSYTDVKKIFDIKKDKIPAKTFIYSTGYDTIDDRTTPRQLSFKNSFFEHLSEKTCLNTWIDIENEYYKDLKKCLKLNEEDRNQAVKKLNTEFDQVKNKLEIYLTKFCIKDDLDKKTSIAEAFESPINLKHVALSKKVLFFEYIKSHIKYSEDPDVELYHSFIDNIKEEENASETYRTEEERIEFAINKGFLSKWIRPHKTLILNFNYTQTAEKLYAKKITGCEIINIHGELNNPKNPIIFGYGDELDDDYKKIENTFDDDLLENIKSIKYHNTGNYRQLVSFLQSEPYQVFIMGHSCGNSDRTLLNKIFEHSNCISVKPFYWDKGNNTDNHTDLVKNISRNFNDKQTVGDIVVNKEYCKPLVPYNNKQ